MEDDRSLPTNFTNCVCGSDIGIIALITIIIRHMYHVWSHLIIFFFFCFSKGKVIYHQTMTPTDIRTHASRIANEVDPQSSLQITFKIDSTATENLLRIPLLPAGVFRGSALLTIHMTVANNVSLATGTDVDSDITYGVSSGFNYVGFVLPDANNYITHAPCYGIEGKSGVVLISQNFIEPFTPRLPSSAERFYPGRFEFTFKLNQRRAFCYTAQVGGYVKDATYTRQLDISKGLNLEVYKSNDKNEEYGTRLITVAVINE